MSTKDQLPTIDLADLAQVSGGATATTASADPVLTALGGILDSLQSITSQSSGGFNQQEMLLFMMVMQQRNQQAAASAAWPWSQQPIVRYY